MNITDCYHLLGLSVQASLIEVKASYRRLARQYHPDINPGNRQAQEKFIQITEAYKILLRVVPPTRDAAASTTAKGDRPPDPPPPPAPASERNPTVDPAPKVTVKSSPSAAPPPLSEVEQQLKSISYQQLRELLKYQRFPRAVALVEGLSQRLPEDPEVRQWQAITYQRWGRHLIGEKQLDKARIYLKKALRTDPHNRSLWAEVEQDFRRLEKVF